MIASIDHPGAEGDQRTPLPSGERGPWVRLFLVMTVPVLLLLLGISFIR